MIKISDLFSGYKLLEEKDSLFNGKVTVTKLIGIGTTIKVGGLTQSGQIIENIWKTSLRKVRSNKLKEISEILILGLGGGSMVKVINKIFPGSKITAVDIDPLMVELGEKHLGLDRKSVDIQIDDAYVFAKKTVKAKIKFDLICVDLYVGDEYPEKFESQEFMMLVMKLLKNSGAAVFNRLYYDEKRPQSVKFGNNLSKVFPKVEVIYPEANIMFVCYN
jgi:spermidine synthase